MADRQAIEEANALCTLAARASARDDHAAAAALYERGLALYEGAKGVTGAALARCLYGLGRAQVELARLGAAQASLERAVAIRERELGAEHPDTAHCLHALAEVRFDAGDVTAGQAMMERALKVRQQALGAEHPDSIESQRMLALMKAHRGDRHGGLLLLEDALAMCQRALGAHHLSTANVWRALGLVLAAGEDSRPQARRAYERALAILEQTAGPDSMDSALVLNNLASLLIQMGAPAEALPLLERSLAVHQQRLGTDHPRTTFVLTNLADLRLAQGTPAAARLLLERALIIRVGTLGARHPLTLTSLRKLVALLGDMHQAGDEGALAAAMPLHRCLVALEAAAGKLDPADRNAPGAHLDPARAAQQLHELTDRLEAELNRPPLPTADQADLEQARALYQEAGAAYERGEFGTAESLLGDALALQERVLGPSHLEHAKVLRRLARVKQAQGQDAAVLPLLRRVAELHEQALGPGHPATLSALGELASLTAYEYGLAAMVPLQAQMVASMEQALGPDDPWVGRAREAMEQLRGSEVAAEGAASERTRSRSERREDALAALLPEQEAPLSGLDDLPWHELRHAYGPASDVPNLLRLLLADDAAVRDDAWEHLYSNVWHQGTVYEATAHVVPFLLRMLAHGEPPPRAEVLHFLGEIAAGRSYLEVHAAAGRDQSTWRGILAEQGRDLDAELSQELAWARAAQQAVARGVPQLLELVAGDDPEVRTLALQVLSRLPGQAEVTVPRLQALLAREQDAALQAGIVQALLALMDSGLEAQQFFAQLVEQTADPRMAFLAAGALAARAREQTPEAAVEALVAGIQVQVWDQEAEAAFPAAWEEDSLWFGLRALASLGIERGCDALLLALPDIQGGDEALQAAGVLLDLVFNAGVVQDKAFAVRRSPQEAGGAMVDVWRPEPQPRRESSSFSERERGVLLALLNHAPVWQQQHNLLRLYGLPTERDALRAFLAREQRGKR